jgi:predicted MPP superfamily phosphohydrolase
MTRRFFFRWISRIAATGAALATYGFVIEPGFRLNTTSYAFTPPRWTPGLKLRIVMLADPHCIEPHMPLSRWEKIIAAANALEPDVHLLMGDYVASHRISTGRVSFEEVADAALALKAPLGTLAIMGNHDWWEDVEASQKGTTARPHAQHVFAAAGLPVLDNSALRFVKEGKPFWLSGTNSLVALRRPGGRFESRADLEAALSQVTDDAPIIHLAHEPDLFVDVPERVSLTLSGHTHGGQVRLFGYSPVTPSAFGNRFAYGHVVENGRHLIVSGGLGCSILPIRFGVPPEIVLLELG